MEASYCQKKGIDFSIIYAVMFIEMLYIPGTPMTSIFEGQPPKTRPNFQPKTAGVVIWGFQTAEEGLRHRGRGWHVDPGR